MGHKLAFIRDANNGNTVYRLLYTDLQNVYMFLSDMFNSFGIRQFRDLKEFGMIFVLVQFAFFQKKNQRYLNEVLTFNRKIIQKSEVVTDTPAKMYASYIWEDKVSVLFYIHFFRSQWGITMFSYVMNVFALDLI